MILHSLALLLALSPSWPANAWNGRTHSEIIRLALGNDPGLAGALQPEPLESFLADTSYKTVPAFIAALRLNPSVQFPYKLREDAGAMPEAVDVLSTYVNEPDWGMDKEICLSYRDYCTGKRADLRYMGAFAHGLPSQAFRHMYWPSGYVKLLSKYLPLPHHVDRSIGEAPERSQLFFDLSVKAGLKHPYWAARLLAWSIHYAQDVSQPFHAAQLPSKSLVAKKLLIFPDIKGTVTKLAYYHLDFEAYTDAVLSDDPRLAQLLPGGIGGSLKSSISGAPLLDDDSPRQIVEAAAAHSLSESFAKRAGDESIRFFPKIRDMKALPARMKSGRAVEDIFTLSRPGLYLEDLVAVMRACLAEGGSASRTLVELFRKRTTPMARGEQSPAVGKVVPDSVIPSFPFAGI